MVTDRRTWRRRLPGWAGVVVFVLSATPVIAANEPALVTAVKRGDAVAVRRLIQAGAAVNAVQPSGATALHWAARLDAVETAKALLKAGARVDGANAYGVTPLALACLNASPAMIQVLLDAGADPGHALPSGETPLMTAARTGRVAALSLLLARGTDVNARESESAQTALMWAVSEKHLDVVRTLVEHGADLRARSATGFTPLMFAAREGHLEIARFLLASGADANDTSNDGTSVLLVATVRGHADVAGLLIDRGADVNASGTGYTPLHWAVGRWESSMTKDYPVRSSEWTEIGALSGVPVGKLGLIKSLLAHGADPNARAAQPPPRFGIAISLSFTRSQVGATPFIFAAMSGDAAVMRLLLASGADPLLTSNDGTTALMAASGAFRAVGESVISEASSVEAVQVAVSVGASLDAASTAEGNTALHAAAFFGLPQVVLYLGEAGANLNAKNKAGFTPLKVAEGVLRGGQFWASPPVAAALHKLGARLE